MFSEIAAFTGIFLAGFLSGYPVLASDGFNVNCEAPTWVGSVSINPEDRLTATLTRQCQIVLNVSGSISSLNAHVLDSIPKENTVNVGPVQETFSNLSSIYFEVTRTSDSDGYQTVFDNQLHIASDNTQQLLKVSKSKKITGDGDAQYLKVLNDEQGVNLDSHNALTYQFIETQYVELERPSFAPKSIFISESKKELMKAFTRDSQMSAKQLAQYLIN